MIIVGELINGSREAIAKAVAQRDAKAILDVAQKQVEAGAHLLDINAGTDPDREVEDLLWLVEVVLEELDVPLCIDSPNFQAIEVGLKKARERAAMINSITGETKRLEAFLPLIEACQSQIITLCMDDSGIPETPGGRLEIAVSLVEKLTAHGVQASRIFFDPIIRPVSTDSQAGQIARDTLRLIKKELPGVNTICGLSNISFGLPHRQLLNRNYLTILLAEGLDAAILDPTDGSLMANLSATQALLGKDTHCLNYISAHREGRLA